MNWSEEFDRAKESLPPSQVNWGSSPWAWVIHTSPTVKNAVGLEAFLGMLKQMGVEAVRAPSGADYHLLIGEYRVRVHTSAASSDGSFRFGQLRSPGMGVDMHYLLGIEPHKVTVWRVAPEGRPAEAHHFREHVEGLWAFSFPCDEPPGWLREVNQP